jgi:hypothetical protein
MLLPLLKFIEGLEKARFYGTIELKYEAGRIVLVRKSETLKFDTQVTSRNLEGQVKTYAVQV